VPTASPLVPQLRWYKSLSNKVSNVWSEAKKIEAVTTWLALGNIPLVEGVTGVPRATLRQWKVQPWWKDLVNEIQTEDDQQLDGKLSKVVERSLDAVMERIEGGEFHIDSRTGQVKRVPVKLRDVHRVMVDVIDKRNLIRGKPTSRTEKVEGDILVKLATQFALWASNALKEKTIEGEVVQDAVYAERETRLQNRVQQVPQSAETNTQPGTPEPSP
jgi:hypothetical protein